MSITHVIVGLGSNIDSIKNLRKALLLIRQIEHLKIKRVSKIYESKAMTLDQSPQSDFSS
jgi:7,8-dihydro-6-hydroxymethylpterin-pyrophosphokinase